jgi:hypothetical protein
MSNDSGTARGHLAKSGRDDLGAEGALRGVRLNCKLHALGPNMLGSASAMRSPRPASGNRLGRPGYQNAFGWCQLWTTGIERGLAHPCRRTARSRFIPARHNDAGSLGGHSWRDPDDPLVSQKYSRKVQQPRRPKTSSADHRGAPTCANDPQRPPPREFATRGSGVRVPSAPPRVRSDG